MQEHLTASQASITERRHAEPFSICGAARVQTEPSVSFSRFYSSRFRLRLCQPGPRHAMAPIANRGAFNLRFQNVIPDIFAESGHQPTMLNLRLLCFDVNERMNARGARQRCVNRTLVFSVVCFGGQ